MNIKYIVPLSLLFFSQLAIASEVNSCNTHKKKSDCEVVRVLTRCDIDKQRLRSKINSLEKRVQELESELKFIKSFKPSERVTEKLVYVHTVACEPSYSHEKPSLHSILSIYTTQDVTSIGAGSSGGVSTATIQQSYVLGIKYQYVFDFGLVPEIGIDTQLNPIFGLGWKF